jgi:hypothetical protein
MKVVIISEDAAGRPVVGGDLNDLHPAWRRQTEGRLALQSRGAALRVRRAPIPRTRRTCVGGNRRPRTRSRSNRTHAPPSGGDADPGGDPEPEHLAPPFLLAGRDRRLVESMARVGVAV